jgi:gamma-glutamylcyclotransferase (GGCT)/AIG2-like uncharacterized protein YtfP
MMYVGYGSNLDPRDWSKFCGDRGADPSDLRPITPVLLLDHRLTFNHRANRWKGGAANVTHSPGDVVPCMAFEVDHPRIWNVLDAKEGVSDRPGRGVYERFEALALLPDGTVQTVTTYRLTEKKLAEEDEAGRGPHVPPSEDYIEAVTRGLAHHGLPSAHLGPASEDRSASPLQHVFVYGTLLAGEERGQVLEACERRQATVTGQLVDLNRGYPGLVPGEATVHGELVRLPDEAMLARLDGIEGFHEHTSPSNLYRRGFVQVQCEGKSVWAWTYYWNGMDLGEAIPSGDWRQR